MLFIFGSLEIISTGIFYFYIYKSVSGHESYFVDSNTNTISDCFVKAEELPSTKNRFYLDLK